MNLAPQKVQAITLAACVLHNFLLVHGEATYAQNNATAEACSMSQDATPMLRGLIAQSGNHAARTPTAIRKEFCNFFNGVGSVPWQDSSAM